MDKKWFYRNLGDAMLAEEVRDELEKAFKIARTKANNSDEMALFIRHESNGHLHCEIIVYFSPASALIARELGARPCLRPSVTDLHLSVGSDMCWSLLFPEANGSQTYESTY